jgi:hypothetical protein
MTPPVENQQNAVVVGRLPFPPPGFPRINAKWLSSSGEETVMDDIKLRLDNLADAHCTGSHRPNIVATLERRIWEHLVSCAEANIIESLYRMLLSSMGNQFFSSAIIEASTPAKMSNAPSPFTINRKIF